MNQAAIRVQGLQKSFKGTQVLRGVGIAAVSYLFAMRAYRRKG